MKKPLQLFLLLVCTLVFKGHAQSKKAIQSQYRFKHITVDQGLSNNKINAICQDALGFIWMGTPNGVDKYDGQIITPYKHNPEDSTSLSSNGINDLFLDSKNNLWIATSAGLDRYDIENDNFVRFSKTNIDSSLTNVGTLDEDNEGKLWLGGPSGLFSYDLNTAKTQVFNNDKNFQDNIPQGSIGRLLVDSNNNIWFSAGKKGVGVYYQDEERFEFFKSDSEDTTSLRGTQIERIYEDKAGNIWIGTFKNGLNLFNPGNNSFTNIIPDPNNSYTTRVRAIFEDFEGNFFVGTRGGLYMRNDQSNTFSLYANEEHDFSSLSQNSILCSFIDKTNSLWIGTYAGGVNYTDLNKKEFIHYEAGKNSNYFLTGTNNYAISEDHQGNLWIGGDNGLNFLDRSTHKLSYFLNDPDDPSSLSYNDIKSLEIDKKGNVWIGTNNGGLNYYDTKIKKFKAFKHDPENPNSIAGNRIYGLMNDKNDNLWIITTAVDNQNRLNIDMLESGSEKFVHIAKEVRYGMDQNENGQLYFGGQEGFWVFDQNDNVFSFISNDLLIGDVNSVKIDSEGRLWVGSNKGLVRYNFEDQTFTSYSQENGYPISKVVGILEDDSKNLWVSTITGLLKISNAVVDTTDISIRVYDSDDGLQSKQFNYNSYFKSNSGEMAFGGINGINTFFPSEIKDNKTPPKVVISNLKIFNNTTPIGKEVRGRVVLTKSISVTDKIELGMKQNVFSISFSALHFANPKNNTFKYKLEGFDPDWQYRTSRNNTATYSNLEAGEYTFLVNAANPDGIWNDEPVRLKIVIIPPFWKTMWFYALVIIFIVFGIWMFTKIRERQLKVDKDQLKNELEKGKAELAENRNEIEKQKEAIRKKEESEADMKWYNEGIVIFSELISKYKENVVGLSDAVLGKLVPYIGALQGAIFIINDENLPENEKRLELISSYAFSDKKLKNKSLHMGQGLIGACFKSTVTNQIYTLPNNYAHLTSGLGEVSLNHLLLVPIKQDDLIIGVIELASIEKIDDHKVDLIEKIAENITSVISIVRRTEQAELAVKLANEQKEEVLAQEEELRQNMEELQTTQDELVRQQEQFETETAILETLLSFLKDRITIKNTEGIYLRVNQEKANALKLQNPEDAVGKTDANFYGEEHFQKALDEEKKLLKSGKGIFDIEEKLKFKDGSTQWGVTSRIPFKNLKGELVGTLIITKNNTDQKLLDGQYKSQNELIKEFTSSNPIIFYETNHAGIISQIFGNGLEILGIKNIKLGKSTLFSIFKDLKGELDFEKLKGKSKVEYSLEFSGKSLNLTHHIIKNPSSDGITAIVEIGEELVEKEAVNY